MDFEDEWEFLPDSGFLDFQENPDRKIFSGKRGVVSNPKSVFDMNYFMCPSPESNKIIETSSENSSTVKKQIVSVPIQLEPAAILKGKDPEDDHELTKEVIKLPLDVTFAVPEKIKRSNLGSIEADQDAVSQVFFKKMKENEFVDMKMDSPKSPRNIIPQVDAAGAFKFEDDTDHAATKNMNSCSPRKKKTDFDADKEEENNNLGLNLWKWGLTGIGAICSFGVAAATICIVIFGNQQKINKHQQQNEKLRFQIYTEDERIKQAVQQATKLNEAISAARGVPITRAHITYGGYYDAL